MAGFYLCWLFVYESPKQEKVIFFFLRSPEYLGFSDKLCIFLSSPSVFIPLVLLLLHSMTLLRNP